eukprot:Clim_evm13s157 gene=Clim_evmTU13s157
MPQKSKKAGQTPDGGSVKSGNSVKTNQSRKSTSMIGSMKLKFRRKKKVKDSDPSLYSGDNISQAAKSSKLSNRSVKGSQGVEPLPAPFPNREPWYNQSSISLASGKSNTNDLADDILFADDMLEFEGNTLNIGILINSMAAAVARKQLKGGLRGVSGHDIVTWLFLHISAVQSETSAKRLAQVFMDFGLLRRLGKGDFSANKKVYYAFCTTPQEEEAFQAYYKNYIAEGLDRSASTPGGGLPPVSSTVVAPVSRVGSAISMGYVPPAIDDSRTDRPYSGQSPVRSRDARLSPNDQRPMSQRRRRSVEAMRSGIVPIFDQESGRPAMDKSPDRLNARGPNEPSAHDGGRRRSFTIVETGKNSANLLAAQSKRYGGSSQSLAKDAPSPVLGSANVRGGMGPEYILALNRRLQGARKEKTGVNIQKMVTLFDALRDPTSDTIRAGGYCRLCERLGFSDMDVVNLIMNYYMHNEAMGEVTREQWKRGCRALKASSMRQLRDNLAVARTNLQRVTFFRDIYQFAFDYITDSATAQGAMPVELALAGWKVLLDQPDVPEFIAQRKGTISLWFEYLEGQKNHDITYIDSMQWRMFLEYLEVASPIHDVPSHRVYDDKFMSFRGFESYCQSRMRNSTTTAAPSSPAMNGDAGSNLVPSHA